MYFSFLYNRCSIDPVTALGMSANDPPEHTDMIRYKFPGGSIFDCTQSESNCTSAFTGFHRCSCETCKGETAKVVINTTQHNVETAIDMNPLLMNIVRLSAMSKSYYAVYTFVIPSILNKHVLNDIVKQLNASHMFVSTRYNMLDDIEDTSIYKLIIYQRRTPYSGLKDYIEWMRNEIEVVIGCKPIYYSINYVSSFKPMLSYK
jgi:hypothetical protein